MITYDAGATLLGLVGVGSLIVYLNEVCDSADTSDSFTLVLGRLGITLGALAIAGVLASRGAENHKEARDANRTALALSRLAPFIVNLKEDAREVLTIETADRIFTRGELGKATERESVLEKVNSVRERQRELGGEDA